MLLRKLYLLLIAMIPITVLGAYADSSVLAKGRWYKLAVTRQGIHQLTYSDMVAMGINPSAVEVGKIRLFGNGAGMLPEVNSSPRIDDLREIAIEVKDGGDGHFDEGDLVLFFGEAADKWKYERLTRNYSHIRNLYSDTTYYYLNFDQVPGSRVQPMPVPGGVSNYHSSTFDGFIAHELDLLNLIRSGKEWYGETFENSKPEWVFPFTFPLIDTTSAIKIKWAVAANSSVVSYFHLWRGTSLVDSLKIDPTDPKEFTRAGRAKIKVISIPVNTPDQSLRLTYNMPTANSKGWLNYLELACRQNLSWIGPQLLFRDINAVGPGRVTEFTMTNASPSVTIWDVTNPAIILAAVPSLVAGDLKFSRETDTLREFIAFDGSFYYPVILRGEIPNQDLHASTPAKLIIVTHPKFLAQAEQLGNFHREHNGLTTTVVTTSQVYTEFSGGQPDPASIRDFVRMLFLRGSVETRPKYLLLFGDGSYDPKDRVPGNNAYIPTFQSVESLNSTSSYVTDDFYGIMVENGGQESNGIIDIGIGRFPVSTVEEAQGMVDKILHYSTNVYPVASDWRNTITFVADDENQNLHLHQAEEMVDIVAAKYPVLNIDKIYLDAYPLVKIPGGERFPDANLALNDAVEKGSLIVNYTGHGGETGWSFEQVLTAADLQSWSNTDKMPVFVTATCEFSRFDNPERFTAGEMLILQTNGGAIGLYSTTRLAFAGINIGLNTSFYKHLMDKETDGQYIKMGDLIRLSKNENSNNFQLRNFVLLGDPAQNIAFSDLNVRATSINGKPVSIADTLEGMATVTVGGRIEDAGGQKVSDFNGVVNCKLFDKPATNTTLGNRPNGETYPEDFKLQDVVLFKGDVPVVSGEFLATFVVPRTIAQTFGRGKLSFFASNELNSASGYTDQFMIGGRDGSVTPDNQGPEIGLYLDSRMFINGGTTGTAAILLVDLFDTNGINYLGLGIGHEIEAVLDGDRSNAMVLNDYYEGTFDSYTRGTVAYPLDGLLPGRHTLSLKAWDMYDNSSVQELVFYVPEQSQEPFRVKNVMNAPNPLVDQTRFIFQPEQLEGGGLDVQISIYNLKGIRVQTLAQTFSSLPDWSNAISWDGTDANGKKLSNGIYPYKIVFKAANGGYSETSQKIIIAR